MYIVPLSKNDINDMVSIPGVKREAYCCLEVRLYMYKTAFKHKMTVTAISYLTQ